MATFTPQTKTSATWTAETKTMTPGLWSALTFPWTLALPWQYTGGGTSVTWTAQTKS